MTDSLHPPDLARLQIAEDADPLVVKVGTRALTHPDGSLDQKQIESLSEQLVAIGAGTTRRVALVSSGAVGAGIGRLGLKQRPTDLAGLQAAAAIGQGALIEAYHRTLTKHGRVAAQVLLTADDFHERRRYLNVRNTLESLFAFGAIPIVNENDTVRTEELARNVGDNDRLAAMLTNLLRAPLLIILSDVEGLYDGDPNDSASQVIGMVNELDETTNAFVRAGDNRPGPALSKGGMGSKLSAAQIAVEAGESVILANGRRPNVLIDLLAGAPIGTLLPGVGGHVASRKRWIAWAAHPQGQLRLDTGATRAVDDQGASLLPVGITAIVGTFSKGDVVSLRSPEGQEIARGLTNYDAEDLRKIAGKTTEEVATILGRVPYVEAVHRSHLALVRGTA
ncbi:glutamate 5-kinase [Botrimarina hoheduenensis]|uniref:Glutamate 5-kinase n=1 Tax=Botrimarina hoheduenensis TaxID=2528000 RepID=A0A5C5VZQ1_9BACT|nr:glutamate 5-kinase [Botrimarina hoheduenensis]TWT43271.1 Glutamate 5-kinase [Botrimarina hoheduenensis]